MEHQENDLLDVPHNKEISSIKNYQIDISKKIEQVQREENNNVRVVIEAYKPRKRGYSSNLHTSTPTIRKIKRRLRYNEDIL